LLEVARTEKSCSKRKKLLKSCRAQSGHAYPAQSVSWYFDLIVRNRVIYFRLIYSYALGHPADFFLKSLLDFFLESLANEKPQFLHVTLNTMEGNANEFVKYVFSVEKFPPRMAASSAMYFHRTHWKTTQQQHN
jgi:hypothetical protein